MSEGRALHDVPPPGERRIDNIEASEQPLGVRTVAARSW